MLIELFANLLTLIFIAISIYILIHLAYAIAGAIEFYSDLIRARYMKISVRTFVRNPHLRKGILKSVESKDRKEEFVKMVIGTHALEQERTDLDV